MGEVETRVEALGISGKGATSRERTLPWQIEPLELFDRPVWRQDCRGRPAPTVERLAGKRMAGYAGRLEPREVSEWLRMERPPERALEPLRCFFGQLRGHDIGQIVHRGECSIYDLVRAAHACDTTHWQAVSWLNGLVCRDPDESRRRNEGKDWGERGRRSGPYIMRWISEDDVDYRFK